MGLVVTLLIFVLADAARTLPADQQIVAVIPQLPGAPIGGGCGTL